MDDSTPSKACSICKETLPLTAFGVNNSTADRLQRFCRACCQARRDAASPERQEQRRAKSREYAAKRRAERGYSVTPEAQRAWKAKNPDKVRAYRQRFRANHRERILLEEAERRAQLRAERPEELAAYFAAVYDKKRDIIRARSRAWQIENPERYRELKQRRRARVRGSKSEPVDVLALWTGNCGICDEVMETDIPWPESLSPSLDHIIPLCKGGTHTQQNLQWAHLVCNLRKGSKVP